MPVPFFRVENEAACAAATQPSWYYDNPAAPTQIHLCPSACMTVTAETPAGPKIEIADRLHLARAAAAILSDILSH